MLHNLRLRPTDTGPIKVADNLGGFTSKTTQYPNGMRRKTLVGPSKNHRGHGVLGRNSDSFLTSAFVRLG